MSAWSDVIEEATNDAICDGTAWACFTTNHSPFDITRSRILRTGAEVAYLAHQHNVRIMWEDISITGTTDDGIRINLEKYRFWVASADLHGRMVDLCNNIIDSDYLFDDLDSLDVKDFDTLPIETVIKFSLAFQKGYRDIYDIWLWCRDNLRGKVYPIEYMTAFEFKEDAMMFKLKFAQ